ncbi:hypothetical protein KCP78_13545 [Salmonella enterica subsp. enterica]|nr:hypothetical protein KCP78_13545 [Salmonella enterica subsp. enterica]
MSIAILFSRHHIERMPDGATLIRPQPRTDRRPDKALIPPSGNALWRILRF